MKILSYEERDDGMLVVTTDYAPMPEFVVEMDRFSSVASLEKELLRLTELHTIKRQRRDARRQVLRTEMDAAIARGKP